MIIKSISLTQPWASLIAIGAKTIETRSWPTRYRGWLAIHAAKGLAGMEDAVKLPILTPHTVRYFWMRETHS